MSETIHEYETCPACKGKGRTFLGGWCEICRRTGRVIKKVILRNEE